MDDGAVTTERGTDHTSERESVREAAPAARWAGDAGMATAEYAIATLAACGFAGLLVAILRGDQVRGMLLGIVQRALSLA